MRLAPLALALPLLAGSLPAPPLPVVPPPPVQPNDNRHPAGTLHRGVLRLDLEVRLATWKPEGPHGDSIVVPAFAERGGPPMIPGPLVRVPEGTVVEATILNRLTDSAITVRGFLPRPATAADSLVVPPGGRRAVRFVVGAAGTYYYSATVGTQDPGVEREQLAGAFVVDPPGPVRPDRIFVINIWGTPVDSVVYRNALAINGQGWPFTERIRLAVGDSVRWRVINPSIRPHPMHLHGFFFRVESVGTRTGDTVYAEGARRLVVTEDLRSGHTMTMAWAPERPGNWLFHCHISAHVVPETARLDTATMSAHDHERDHMAGLVLGIEVSAPPGWAPPPRPDPARLRMVVAEGPRHGDSLRTVTVALGAPGAEASPVSPGPLLLAERGRPLDVTVVNRLAQGTAIHWHGLELDSYWDGVAGWSGSGTQVAPPIAAGDSFVAHLTVPRAGTFIYHTHLNDLAQVTGGLYGALVVLEPGARWDPARDHVFVLGWDGPNASPLPRVVVNGDTTAPPLVLEAGVPQRLRFVNILVGGRLAPEIRRDGALASWEVVAVDGADLPAAARHEEPARRAFNAGMTYDARFVPAPGTYELRVPLDSARVFYRQRIEVR